MRHPLQPIYLDHERPRFQKNAIVEFLLDTHPTVDLNELARRNFSDADRQQFAQLIGYSVSGYCELSYVDGLAADVACAAARAAGTRTTDSIRLEILENTLTSLREQLCRPMAMLFDVHPDDLHEIKNTGEMKP